MFNFGKAIEEMKAGKKVTPWIASQSDMLAEDWFIVE